MQVIVQGVADVSADLYEPQITDAAVLQTLDEFSLDTNENCGDYMSDYMANTGLRDAVKPSGDIELRYDAAKNQVKYVTEFETTRPLTDSELTELRNYTMGQWSDGMGSGVNSDCWEIFGLFVDFNGERTEIWQLDGDGNSLNPPVPPVVDVVMRGSFDELAKVLDEEPNIDQTFEGSTALQFAITQNRTEMALELVERGAKLDFYNRQNEDALSLAAMWLQDKDAAKLIRAILDKDIAARGRVKLSLRRPAIFAIERQKLETLDLILDAKPSLNEDSEIKRLMSP